MRRHQVGGTTPAPLFFQLKTIFHILESLGSARIEGNHTTLADYVDHKLGHSQDDKPDQLKEIENIERAMDFVERSIRPGDNITEIFVRGLHALTVDCRWIIGAARRRQNSRRLSIWTGSDSSIRAFAARSSAGSFLYERAY